MFGAKGRAQIPAAPIRSAFGFEPPTSCPRDPETCPLKRLTALTTLALAFLLAMTTSAFAQQGPEQFQVDLQPQNDSGATGTATLTLDGDQLTVDIQSQGLTPGQPHAQHIHGDLPDEEIVSECPPASADEDGDGIVSTVEGQPFYGMVLTSLTTEGDVGPDSGLAVERFPVADDNGSLSYSRTFTVNSELNVDDLADYAIVQHGIDLDDSGAYDGEAKSSLDPSLPLEATVPANCGTISAMPGGGVATGAGGTAADTTSSSELAMMVLAAAAVALGVWFTSRRTAQK